MSFASIGCSGTDPQSLVADTGVPDTLPTPDAAVEAGLVDVAAPVDASSDTLPVEAAPDVAMGPPDSQIQCGPSTTCSAQTQVCCWHSTNTVTPFECLSSITACSGAADVPMTCSTAANCASQGLPGSICCATLDSQGTGMCAGDAVPSIARCKTSCTASASEYQIGCDTTAQNCADSTRTCYDTQCDVPGGGTLCY
jgi:hypothetical protein